MVIKLISNSCGSAGCQPRVCILDGSGKDQKVVSPLGSADEMCRSVRLCCHYWVAFRNLRAFYVFCMYFFLALVLV